jgi:Fe2+ transport system protein FeoA
MELDTFNYERDWSMLLSDMKEGETGKIIRIGGHGALRRRIFEMGLLKDSEVYVEKYAPLKDPIELIVKGYHLSMRVNEASQITVEKLDSSVE